MRLPSTLGSTIAASAATFTAVVAVVIAVWDNVQTREHNRLSVLPYVVIQRTQQQEGEGGTATITMSNEGVGPAILQSVEIRVPTATGRDTVVSEWGAAAPYIQRMGLGIRGWMDVDSGIALGVQRSGVLLRAAAEGDSAMIRVQQLLDGLALRLRYASIYGQRHEATLGDW
ncbi:MAG TPA: hypothetical protein VFQ45_12880 [Longimicrobium sp.]|nr:hypothetical protein [Longimicrobium sp.]